MKVLSLGVFLISITYLVGDANCGVIDNVYGSVQQGTHAVRDRVNSWWSFGKDILFGDIEAENFENSEKATVDNVVVKPERSLIGSLYSSVVDSYRAARARLHDLLIDKENGQDKGVIKTMYGRVSKRVSRLKSYLTGYDNKSTETTMHPLTATDIVALRESLANFLKAQNEKNQKNGERIRNEIGNAGNKLKEVYEAGKDGLNEFGRDASKRISDGKDATNDAVNKLKEVYEAGKDGLNEFGRDANKRISDGTHATNDAVNKLKEGYEAGKDRLYELGRDANTRISDGTHATNDAVNKLKEDYEAGKDRLYEYGRDANTRISDGTHATNDAVDKLKESYEAGKDRLYEYGRDTSKRISDGTHATNELVHDKVDNLKHDIQDSFSNLHDNMNDLTEREKEILNSIATNLRNRVSNVYGSLRNTGEDLKKLSYGGSTETPSNH